jgi:sugar phosphate isomerase/epimerase
MKDNPAMDIRIGTLVNGGPKAAEYIRQILPHGFESFSITFWQTIGSNDVARIAADVKKALEGSNAIVSSLGIFGNPLCDEPLDRETLAGWRTLIDNAHLFGCDIVAGFAGRLRGKPIPDSIGVFKERFGELAARAREKRVRIAFENCAMGGDWGSGDWNIAHNPHAWDLMFQAVPLDNVGLEWEPCHQMVSLIDPMPQLRRWVKRIFHVHGKDATVLWDVVRRDGVDGPEQFAFHRTPGFGDSNWADIISELRRAGFKGSIDIEGWHDPVYRKELEMTGQVHALNYLKRCRGGEFVPNPT